MLWLRCRQGYKPPQSCARGGGQEVGREFLFANVLTYRICAFIRDFVT